MRSLITGCTFSLRRPTADDAEPMFQMVQANRSRLEPYLAWTKKTVSLKDQKNFYLRATREWEAKTAYHFVIVSKDHLVGAISIHTIDPEKGSFEFGYWLDEAAEGCGYISQAISLLENEMLSMGFKEPRLKIHKNNKRSIRIAERLGLEALESIANELELSMFKRVFTK